ncbi:fungal-specific transcription factor domain-containing protein [Xylaria arbuscula]|nr:fungal-specific transcription factor domain-containing protein [Xylaria arbuscula]
MPMTSSNLKEKSRQGCWTCKARKVKCDRGLPNCQRCATTQRECEGYGLRLSWPKDNDRRRAIRATVPTTGSQTRTQYQGDNSLINTTSQDIELYQYLSSFDVLKSQRRAISSPKLWRNPQSEMTHMELLYYFREAAHYSLVTFSSTTLHVRDSIMQMVFTHDTVSRRALFYALLAFSSLHRTGLHQETMSFKVTALKALSDSAKEAAQGSVEAAQHVAACMILCAFEILLPTENSGEWLWYIRGAMQIIQRAELGYLSDESGNGDLLDWVYFHDSMSQFTLYHWRHKYLAAEATDTTITPIQPIRQSSSPEKETKPPVFRNRPHAILNVLSEICEVLLDPSDPRSQEIEYKNRLRALEWKVDNLPSLPPLASELDESSDEVELTAQLYRISTRVYLTRASQDPREPPVDLDALINSAFAGPVRSCHCRHFFPLLIIAGEAHTEEQRAAILNLIDRTEKYGYVRSMTAFRSQVQSFWIQQDLHSDGDIILNYLGLMKAIVSSDRALPSYV